MKKCSNCGKEDMVKGYIEGQFSGMRNDGVCDHTKTIKYMCKFCGRIDEYAENTKFIERTDY